jgi:hypothetical protein
VHGLHNFILVKSIKPMHYENFHKVNDKFSLCFEPSFGHVVEINRLVNMRFIRSALCPSNLGFVDKAELIHSIRNTKNKIERKEYLATFDVGFIRMKEVLISP